MSNINLAFQLMLVGMIAVFGILSIVVGLGRVLIFLVGKYSKEQVAPIVQRNRPTQLISNKKIAVVTAVVDMVTQQKGIVKSIKKI